MSWFSRPGARGGTRGGAGCLRRLAALAPLSLLLLAAAGCGRPEPVPDSPYRERVRVARAETRLIRPVLDSFGTLVYLNKADVYPTTEGVIERLEAEEGMRVRRGQVLATLSKDRLLLARERVAAEVESREALLALAEEKLREGRKAVDARLLTIAKAEAELAQRQAEFDNVSLVYVNKKRLHEAGGIADGELETVRTRYVAAEMQLAQARSDLEIQRIGFRDRDLRAAGLEAPESEAERREALVEANCRMLAAERAVAAAELSAARVELREVEMALAETTVRAPIDGIVGARLLDLGESASPQTLLFTLFNTETVFAQIEVSETDLTRVAAGQEAEARPDPGGDVVLPGTVELISPYVNPQTRTARVRVRVGNPEGRMVPGMFVRVRVFLGKAEEQVTVPLSALLFDPQGNATAFILRGGRVFRTPVEAGQREEDRVVVRRGLRQGEAVVLDPAASYRDGTEVEVIP